MKRRMRLLVIDDSEDDRELYGRLLKSDGEAEWSIHEAETGEEGLEIYLAEEIDGVLLDYSLPGRDGLKILSDLQDHRRHSAVVVLTGQGNEKIAIESMKMGAQDYLAKDDVTAEKLCKAIHNAVDRVAMMRQIDDQREALEKFSSVLAHDLNAPLHHIRGFCELMELAIEDGEYEKVREYRDFVTKAAGDVLFGPVSMHAVLNDALSNLSGIIEERKAQVSHGPLPEVTGNGVPSIQIAAEKSNGGWSVSVRDNGIGIPEEQYKRIFEPFKRLHGPEEYSGTGLGLATCKKIIDRHKGRIWCESKVGEGTTFTFTLPVE